MDEHLVVEAGGQEARQLVVHRQNVEFQARPVVLRRGGQPVKQFRRGGALVRFVPVARAKVHQGVGFFGPAGDDATRAVVFEAATNHLDETWPFSIGRDCEVIS